MTSSLMQWRYTFKSKFNLLKSFSLKIDLMNGDTDK